MSTIEVISISNEFPLPEEIEPDPLQWYGSVTVAIDGVEKEVGACIGVRDSEKGTYQAARSEIRPFLTAWYEDASDWDSAGLSGEQSQEVIEAIRECTWELWQQTGR